MFNKLLLLGTFLFSSFAFSADNSFKVSAQPIAGCFFSTNDLHFQFTDNQKSKNTQWHSSSMKVFAIDQFLIINAQCSKGTNFGVDISNDNYDDNQYLFSLKHTTDNSAPVLNYWLNNWASNPSSMVSSNIKQKTPTSSHTRLHKGKPLVFNSLDGNIGWIKFAAQIEGSNVKQYFPGEYADILNLRITY